MLREVSGKTVPIAIGGHLVIGNDRISGGNNGNSASYPFGGELTKLNVFSKELTGDEVKAMSDEGLGSCVESTHGEHRRIRWEDILKEKRYGNINQRDPSSLGRKCITVGKFRL